MLYPRLTARTFTVAAAIATLTAALSGCMWWHNFSTYFNTVYLAEKHVEAYEAQQRAIVPPNPNGAVAVLNHRWFDEEYLMRQEGLKNGNAEPINPSFSQSLSATKEINNMHLDSAIILGSKILADKKANKYKEDALFIVGKAQFYKNDFIGAERKFRELLANYPQTKYGAQVQVFLARSMLVNHDIDTAALALERSLGTADARDPAVASSVHRAMAELIYARNPDSLGAIASELHKAETGLSGEELARLAYQEGAVEYVNGDWPSAGRAFQTAANSASDDWLAGEAHVATALVYREEGNYDAAKSELTSVAKHVKYGGSQAAARYELAYTDELIARKAVGNNLRSPEFRERYSVPLHEEYHVLDTLYRSSSALILSRSRFRQAEIFRGMGQYDSAARLAAPLIGTKDFSSSAMNEYVTERANSLASYAEWRQKLDHVDTLESSIEHHEAMRGRASNLGVQNDDEKIHVQAMQEVLGTRWSPNAPPHMTKIDSGRVREIEARLKRNKPTPVVITDTAHFMDSLYFLAGTAHYQLGRAFETFGEIPEARVEYQCADTMNIGPMDTGRTALRAQTVYAWLELEHREKNQPAQDSLLHELLDHYGQTIYAQEARLIFGNSDRNSPGELAYNDAYKVLRESGIETAKPKFLNVVSRFPQDDVAPRSLYAIGESYEEVPRYDSALAYYQRVLKEYPYSSYAMNLRPRLADASTGTPAPPHVAPRTFAPGNTVPEPIPVPAVDTTQNGSQTFPARHHPPGNLPPRPAIPAPGQLPQPQLPPGVRPPPMPPTPPNPPNQPNPATPPNPPPGTPGSSQ